MKQQFIIKENHPVLLLFFSGWASDSTPFTAYHPQGCDFMICYDYRDLTFDYSTVGSYSKIYAVGWSMGVWAGAHILSPLRDKICGSVAINGTRYPSDNERGIPELIFNGTLEGLNEKTLHKFLRRMCGTTENFRKFLEVTPRRPLEEIREELRCISEAYPQIGSGEYNWQKAVIGKSDMIIPAQNQENAWLYDKVPAEFVEYPHYHRDIFTRFFEKQFS